MAIELTSTILHDGDRNLVVQVSGLADGPGDITDVLVVDPTALTPPCLTVKILLAEYDVAGGLVRLIWDDPGDPVIALKMAGQSSRDYRFSGGFANPTSKTPGRAGLELSTVGFDSGSSFSVTLTMQKKF
jgi:hypothetical protein